MAYFGFYVDLLFSTFVAKGGLQAGHTAYTNSGLRLEYLEITELINLPNSVNSKTQNHVLS